MQTVSKNSRFLFLLLVFIVFNNVANGQKWRAGIFSGYTSDCFDMFGREYFKITGSRYSGFETEYLVDKTFGLKLGYGRQETKISTPNYSTVKNTGIERFEFGFTARKAIIQKKLEWMTSLGFGVVRVLSLTDDNGIHFATSFNAGLDYRLFRSLSFRVEGRALQFYSKETTGDFIAGGTTDPSRYGSVVTQGAITGGLVFLIGR